MSGEKQGDWQSGGEQVKTRSPKPEGCGTQPVDMKT